MFIDARYRDRMPKKVAHRCGAIPANYIGWFSPRLQRRGHRAHQVFREEVQRREPSWPNITSIQKASHGPSRGRFPRSPRGHGRAGSTTTTPSCPRLCFSGVHVGPPESAGAHRRRLEPTSHHLFLETIYSHYNFM